MLRQRTSRRKAATRKVRPLFARPQLEPLEDRITPSYTFSLVGHTATVSPVAATGGPILIDEVLDAGNPVLEYSQDNGATFSTNWDPTVAGTNTLAASTSSTIDLTPTTGTGSSVTLGDPASPASKILAQFNLGPAPSAANNSLVIDDSTSTNAAGTYDFFSTLGTITGPAINFTSFGPINSYKLLGGPAGNTFNIHSTFNLTIASTTIVGGAGNDTVSVLGDTSPGIGTPLTIDTGAGLDTVNVTANEITAGTVVNIDSSSSSGSETLNIDTGGTAGTLATGALGRVNYQAAGKGLIENASSKPGFFSSLTGVAAGALSVDLNTLFTSPTALTTTISYAAGDLEADISGVFTHAFPIGDLASISVGGTSAGESLTVDYSNGDPLPASGLTYDPPAATGGNVNSLTLQSSAGGVIFSSETDSATGPGAGAITYSDASNSNVPISYSNLSPVTDTVPTPTFTFDAPAGAAAVNINTGPIVGGAQTDQINDGGAGAFESMNFANKTSVTVNADAAGATFTANIPSVAAGLSTLTLKGGPTAGDVVDIQAVPSITTNWVGGADATVNVGLAGNLGAISGPVNLENPPALNTIAIDDSSDTDAGESATLGTSTSVLGADTFGTLTGLAIPAGGSVNWDIDDGSAKSETASVTINGGAGGTTWTVDQTDAAGIGGVVETVNGNGSDTCNVQATSANAVTNWVGSNVSALNVGNAVSGVQGINGTLNLESPTGFDTVVVDDSADTAAARTVTISDLGANPSDSEHSDNPWGQIVGLAPAHINYEYTDTSNISVKGGTATGGGGNTFDVLATGDPSSGIVGPTTTIDAGNNGDTFAITDGGLFGANQINGGSGNDSFNVTGALSGGATLHINGGTGASTLTVPSGDFVTPTGPNSGFVGATPGGDDVVTSYINILSNLTGKLPIQVDDNQANNNKTNGNGTFTLSGTSSAKFFGWTTVTAAAAFDGSEHVHAGSATDTADATWSYTVYNNTGAAAPYTIYASWAAAAGNATNATYKIYIDQIKVGPVAIATVNQTQTPHTAVFGTTFIQLLASISVPAGPHSIIVVLSDVANGNVVADGIFDPPETDAATSGLTAMAPAQPATGPAGVSVTSSAPLSVGATPFNSLLLDASDGTLIGRFDAPADPSATAGPPSDGRATDRAASDAVFAQGAGTTDLAALDRLFSSSAGDAGSTDLAAPLGQPWSDGPATESF